MSATGEQEVGLFIRALQIPMQAGNTIKDAYVKTLELLMKDVRNRDISKVLSDAVKHKDATIFEVNNNAQADELIHRMEANGIYYVGRVSYQRDGQDRFGVIITNQDKDVAEKIKSDMDAEMNGGLCSKGNFREYANHYSEGHVMEIKGLSNEETLLLASRCKDAHIPIYVEGPNKGGNHVYFTTRDAAKMSELQMGLAVSMHGPAKGMYIDQIKWSQAYQIGAINTILGGNYPKVGDSIEARPVQAGSVVIDAGIKTPNYAEIDQDTVYLHTGKKVDYYSRDLLKDTKNPEYTNVRIFMEKMKQPVLLNKEEFQTYKKLQDPELQAAFLRQKQHEGILQPQSEYKQDLMTKAMDGRGPDGSAFRKGDMIVDAHGNKIQIDKQYLVVSMNGQATRKVQRDTPEAASAMEQAFQKMDNPTYLTAAKAAQYQQLKGQEQSTFYKQEEMSARASVEARPELDSDTVITAKRQEEACRHQVEIKLNDKGIDVPESVVTMSVAEATGILGLSQEEAEKSAVAVATFDHSEVAEDYDNDEIIIEVEREIKETKPTEAESVFGASFGDPEETREPDMDYDYGFNYMDEQSMDDATDCEKGATIWQ